MKRKKRILTESQKKELLLNRLKKIIKEEIQKAIGESIMAGQVVTGGGDSEKKLSSQQNILFNMFKNYSLNKSLKSSLEQTIKDFMRTVGSFNLISSHEIESFINTAPRRCLKKGLTRPSINAAVLNKFINYINPKGLARPQEPSEEEIKVVLQYIETCG